MKLEPVYSFADAYKTKMMTKPICLSLLFLAALLVKPDAAMAQEVRLYQVEVVVFERQYRNDSPLDEKWPRNISLSYPKDTLALSEVQSATDPVQTLASPTNIQRLPESRFKLKKQRNALERDSRLRVLFHGAWEQPLLSAAKAPSIALQGGNGYGEHFELEGSIKLSVSHYVHLDTDLWFSEFVPNHGQQPEYWLVLPTWPDADPASDDTGTGGLMMAGTPAGDDAGESSSDPNRYDANYAGTASLDAESISPLEEFYDDPQKEFLKSPYFIENIVTFRQSRRMRSTEIHYLDHPRLGMLIRVDPVKAQP